MKTKMEQFPAKNPNPVLRIEKDGTVLYTNKAGEPLLHEWGVRVGVKLPPYIGDFVQKVIFQSIPGKLEVKVENRVYLLAFHSIPEEECVNIYGFDISDQRELEEKLQESKERLQLAQQVAKIGTFEWNIQTGVNIWTPELEAIYGLRPGEFGKTQPAWEQLVYPDDLPNALRLVEQAFNTGEPVEGEWRVVWPDGSVHWLTGRWQVFKDATGQPLRMTGVNIDITERKCIEKALAERARLLDLSYDAILVRDANDRIIYWNSGAQEIYGYAKEEALGRISHELLRTEFPQPLEEIFKLLKREGRWTGELVHTCKKGHKIVSDTRWVQDLDPQGNRVTIMETNRDITTRKRAEEALHKAYEKLQAQSEELQVFNEELQVQSEEIQTQNEELQAQSAELQEANEALRESEERFRTMANAIPQLAWIARADGYIYWYNDRWYSYTGTTPEQMEGWGWQSVHDPAVLPKVLEQWKTSIATGQMFDMEFPLRGADGIFRPFLTRVLPLKDAKGRVLQWFGTNTDITKRKKLEEQISQRAEELETVMEVAPVAIWIGHDPQSHNITGNRWANEFYQAEAGENVSANVTAVRRFFYKGRELAADELPMQQASLNDIDVRNSEFDILLPGGEWRTLLGSASPLHDAEGHVRGSVGAFIDITERKKAENKLKYTLDNLDKLIKERTAELERAYISLKESEARFKAYLENTAVIAWMKDEEGRHTFLSSNYEKRFGVRFEDWRGKTDFDLRPREIAEKFHENDLAVLKGGKHIEIMEEARNPDGSTSWWLNSKFPFVDSSGKKYIGGLGVDITESKRMEESLRQNKALLSAILEQLPLGVGLVDTKGHTIINNSIFHSFVDGAIPSKDPENRWRWMGWGADGNLLDRSQWPGARALRGENVSTGLDFLYTSNDGQKTWTRISSVPFRNEAGKIKGAIIIIQDIDEQKRNEEALAKIETARKKEIHHRIKNNLQVISSLLDLEAEKFRDRENIKDLEVLEAFRESQDRVISMALIHEELYKGGGFEKLNFSPYIEELAENLLQTYSLGNTDISLKLDLAETTFFDMDIAVPLGMIVNELVTNSLKHAFPGRNEGEIRIKLLREENGECIKGINEDCSNTFVLSVSDNGMGIPENLDIEDLDSLGLQLVTSLVDQLDGELELKRNNGTEFIIRFTVTENNNQASAPVTKQLIE